LIELLKKPLIVTTHTIPDNASKGDGLVLKEVLKFAEKVIAMMPGSLPKLVKKYNCPKEKIEIIPHGVPDIPLEPNDKHKKKKGFEDKIILGNINLLSASKGLEYTIEALKKIKEQFNNVLYLIIGQTHPVVLKTEGEKYRKFLKEKIKQHDLQGNVKFINKYLSLNELVVWLKIIDVYITPYLDPQQSASGALAYAIGAGKICISTPYLYAKEVLAEGRGIIVPFRNSQAIADAVIDVCENPQKKLRIENKTYKYGRLMTWYNVALQHLELFDEVLGKYKNIKSC
jgi:polysaccharide biosynthesis protein PslF